MSSRFLLTCLSAMALLTVSAAPSDPEHLLRQAADAQASGDYEQALLLYAKAAPHADDPGFIAYNQAMIHYQTGSHAEAAKHFEYLREDPNLRRRARAFLGRGNSLMRADPGSSRNLREVVHCYQQILALSDDKKLREQAKYDLELAKLFLLRALKKEKDNPPENSQENRSPEEKPERGQGDKPERGEDGNNLGGKPERIEGSAGQEAKGEQPRQGEENPQPGKGQRDPQDDREPLPQLSPEEALDKLGEAARRIVEERRQYRTRKAKQSAGGVKDW